mmetsp:Transcript_27457/g.73095  ORF Transcript_27457/g.73095 Transcript_27457/m.73095 type:complete len:111 (+) Transcript_27457:483-815(+)
MTMLMYRMYFVGRGCCVCPMGESRCSGLKNFASLRMLASLDTDAGQITTCLAFMISTGSQALCVLVIPTLSGGFLGTLVQFLQASLLWFGLCARRCTLTLCHRPSATCFD